MSLTMSLTQRELEVLKLLAEGNTARQTAKTLGIASRTVESHAQAIIRKLNVANVTQAVAVAISTGLIGFQ
jgi:two-component system, NarL family, nitrate/nitrite response regulator NarL